MDQRAVQFLVATEVSAVAADREHRRGAEHLHAILVLVLEEGARGQLLIDRKRPHEDRDVLLKLALAYLEQSAVVAEERLHAIEVDVQRLVTVVVLAPDLDALDLPHATHGCALRLANGTLHGLVPLGELLGRRGLQRETRLEPLLDRGVLALLAVEPAGAPARLAVGELGAVERAQLVRDLILAVLVADDEAGALAVAAGGRRGLVVVSEARRGREDQRTAE